MFRKKQSLAEYSLKEDPKLYEDHKDEIFDLTHVVNMFSWGLAQAGAKKVYLEIDNGKEVTTIDIPLRKLENGERDVPPNIAILLSYVLITKHYNDAFRTNRYTFIGKIKGEENRDYSYTFDQLTEVKNEIIKAR